MPSLAPFKIPETRLLVINELVAQVTLTFRTDEDEELSYRYRQNPLLQDLIQTSVISLVNCGYIQGISRGPGFLLHQMRKKWPIGKKYIFTRHGEPLQSSIYKYFFQLEFIDEPIGLQVPEILEISELRGSQGVSASPAMSVVSSFNGSMIDGLDARTLPPMDTSNLLDSSFQSLGRSPPYTKPAVQPPSQDTEVPATVSQYREFYAPLNDVGREDDTREETPRSSGLGGVARNWRQRWRSNRERKTETRSSVPPPVNNIERPEMPPPSSTYRRPYRTAKYSHSPAPPSETSSRASSTAPAVKRSFMQRAMSPLLRSTKRSSVMDRINKFNRISLNGSSSSSKVTRDVQGGIRQRIGTATGFISAATPSRSYSRTSSVGRPASPALSQRSYRSARIRDTIDELEKNGVAVHQSQMSYGKRMEREGADFVSPSKRARAPQY